MPSPIKTLRLVYDLYFIAKTRAVTLGYASWSDYVRGLIRYDAMVQGPHDITIPLSKLNAADQDKIDARLAENVRNGVRERGQYLGALIKELLQKGKRVTGEAISKEI